MRSVDFVFHKYLVKPVLQFYLRRNVKARYDGFSLTIRRGVFHPLLYFSTRFLYRFVSELPLEGRRFLELGCGSGLLSLLAYRKGALVTAVDIDERAVVCAAGNFSVNFGPSHTTQVIRSDLFHALAGQRFDVIVVNPPYYFKKVVHPDQQAWYCGENGEYFMSLFTALHNHVNPDSRIFMSLEENCDIARIQTIAALHGFDMVVEKQERIRWELSLIFRIIPR